jgi:hypothetical protein
MAGNEEQGLLILNDNSNKSARPKSLIQAISEIEQFSVAEMHSELPEGAMPTLTGVSFFEVGVKSSLISGIVTALTTPLMIAAGEELIPVFGDRELTLFDKIFSVLITVSLPVSFALFICVILTRSYAGNITRKAINSLVGGLSSGKIGMTILVVLLFHYVAFITLSSANVIRAINWVSGIFFVPMLHIDFGSIYRRIMDIKSVLIPSAYFIAFVNLLFVGIVSLAVVIGRRKTKLRKEFLREWE